MLSEDDELRDANYKPTNIFFQFIVCNKHVGFNSYKMNIQKQYLRFKYSIVKKSY